MPLSNTLNLEMLFSQRRCTSQCLTNCQSHNWKNGKSYNRKGIWCKVYAKSNMWVIKIWFSARLGGAQFASKNETDDQRMISVFYLFLFTFILSNFVSVSCASSDSHSRCPSLPFSAKIFVQFFLLYPPPPIPCTLPFIWGRRGGSSKGVFCRPSL